MTDPLAGQREAINANEIEALTFPYFDPEAGKVIPCPVKRGQVFELRACRITLLTPERIGKHRRWQWRVPFMRTKRVSRDKVRLLSKHGEPYTDDERQAATAPSSHDSTTVHGVDWQNLDDVEAAQNQTPPLEPEAIDPELIPELPTSVAARARYEGVKAEQRQAFEDLPLSEKVRRLESVSPDSVGRQLARINEATEAAARKLRREGIDLSDEAA